MTTPAKALALPEIDLEGLEKILAAKERANPRDIYQTRNQALLESNEERAQALEAEIGALRRDNEAFAGLLTRMQALLDTRKTYESELAVELAITNAAVAGLKQAGVTRTAQAPREQES